MWKAIVRFELRYQLRQPLLWLIAFLLFFMTFGATSSDTVQLGGSIGNVNRNAPYVIIRMLGIMSFLAGLFLNTVFVARGILRDFDHKTHELFFSRPIRKRDYYLGRFTGATLVSFTVFLATVGGSLLGSLMPWLDPERLGPFMISPYVFSLLVIVLPNLVFTATVFFSLASFTRSMLFTYLGVVGFATAYFISGFMLADLDNQFLAALLDPFGLGAFQEATEYWTIVERNSALPELSGVLLYNRLLWLGVGLVFLATGLWRFRLSSSAEGRWRRKGVRMDPSPGAAPQDATVGLEGLPKAARIFDFGMSWRQLLHQTRIEAVSVFKGVGFIIILAFGVLNLVGNSSFIELIFGTPVYPVTHLMLFSIQRGFVFLLVIIITFYSGELIWKERAVDLAGVYDAMPVPNWVYLTAKVVAQLMVVVTFVLAGIVTTICIQAYHGYTNFELGVYAQGFVVLVVPFLLTCFLASFLQVAAGNKFLGFGLMVLFLASGPILGALDLDHNLYQYANMPIPDYSDMNGYGHFVQPMFWFSTYWTFCAALLAILASLLWVRGIDRGFKTRLRIARQRVRGPVRLALAVAFLGFIATGAWIFYNTNALNEYVPGDLAEKRAAKYEKKYRRYKEVDLPRVRDVYVDVDIFPEDRRVEARGRYVMVNRNERPLKEIHMTIPRRVTVNSLGLPAHTEKLHDELYGYRIYDLQEPLAPGEEMTLTFDLTIDNPGFVNHGSDTSIVYNGTFFNNRQYFPTFGYDEGAQLVDRNDRRKHGLEPVQHMPEVDDLFARRNNFISVDSDWIQFETVVSTRPDQIAVAPGYLQREWIEGGRRYFHYKMDAPILHFYAYLSARYEVLRDRWNDVDIEIYYHPSHTYNLDRMVEGIKKGLDYYTANFSPFQHRQMRILEFPRYASFAQSFPNTVPFSESIGFIARLDEDDEDAIDYPFYVTAHELAHQWWAHQVVGAYVQGATLMSETMSQYAALMVMEKEYGPAKMRRFLKFELDNYLRNRGGELVEENPLLRVEIQPYIHYRKGSVIMYALRDYIGEEALNRALKAYTEAVAFQQPPYTNSLEFLDFIRAEVPPEQQTLLADMFENITLYENRVEEASYARRDDGGYVVTVEAKARKVRADGHGVETEIPIDDWIDVGVFGETEVDGKTEQTVLYLEKHRVVDTDLTFRVEVDQPPVRAGIDPYNKLVDRNSDDNVKSVTEVALDELPLAAGT